jgi:hypothetical protein
MIFGLFLSPGQFFIATRFKSSAGDARRRLWSPYLRSATRGRWARVAQGRRLVGPGALSFAG